MKNPEQDPRIPQVGGSEGNSVSFEENSVSSEGDSVSPEGNSIGAGPASNPSPSSVPSRLLPGKNATVAQTVAYCGVLTALAMVFSYVEALIPINFGVPGVKLGLANLVVLSGLYYMKHAQVLVVSVARILLVGFLFGNGMSIIYSLAGGLLSFFVMKLLIRAGGFSTVGVSIAGGVSHNIGQLAVAALVLQTLSLAWYLPVLLVSGAVTGLLMGLLADRILKALGVGK